VLFKFKNGYLKIPPTAVFSTAVGGLLPTFILSPADIYSEKQTAGAPLTQAAPFCRLCRYFPHSVGKSSSPYDVGNICLCVGVGAYDNPEGIAENKWDVEAPSRTLCSFIALREINDLSRTNSSLTRKASYDV